MINKQWSGFWGVVQVRKFGLTAEVKVIKNKQQSTLKNKNGNVIFTGNDEEVIAFLYGVTICKEGKV